MWQADFYRGTRDGRNFMLTEKMEMCNIQFSYITCTYLHGQTIILPRFACCAKWSASDCYQLRADTWLIRKHMNILKVHFSSEFPLVRPIDFDNSVGNIKSFVVESCRANTIHINCFSNWKDEQTVYWQYIDLYQIKLFDGKSWLFPCFSTKEWLGEAVYHILLSQRFTCF